MASIPPVRRIRIYSGRFGVPGLNPELDRVNARLQVLESVAGSLQTAERSTQSTLQSTQSTLQSVVPHLADIDRHMPAVLNSIASTNGTARLLRRELDARLASLMSDTEVLAAAVDGLGEAIAGIDTSIARLDGHVRDELWPLMARTEGVEALYGTAEWLTQRIEMVRAELMHEVRYGGKPAERDESPEVRVVNASVLEGGGPLRLNLGCGHLALSDYVNVDMRQLPGVDVIAPVDLLPFEPETVDEIFSAHVLEHFPKVELERVLLPYWWSLLKPGGDFRCVVPDIEAMIEQYEAGSIDWEALRLMVYGGQEYEGDFHHNAFTPETLVQLLADAGFVQPEILARGRVNGDCLEFEVTVRRPA